MARYVVLEDLTFEGLPYKRGDILNAPQSLAEVVRLTAALDGVPRVRPAGLEFDPDHFIPVAETDRLGYQHADGHMAADENVIPEPQFPSANSQYD